MNENGNQKQSGKRRRVAIILLLLAILLLLSMVALASRIGGFTWFEKKNEIPIGEETVSSEDDNQNTETKKPLSAEMVVEHDVEIFRVSYANGEAQVTVLSGNGDKLIAPGTSWEYAFTLRNAKDVAIDYTMRVEARVEGMEDVDGLLPVTARFSGPDGWLTDEGGSYIPVLGLNEVNDSGVLSGGNIADYKLEWQWPFESGGEEADAFDTMLGNMAAFDHDIVLYINIIVEAEADTDPDAIGGVSPGTGDDFSAALWVTLMVVSLFAFVFVLIRNGEEKEYFVQEKTARDNKHAE